MEKNMWFQGMLSGLIISCRLETQLSYLQRKSLQRLEIKSQMVRKEPGTLWTTETFSI